MMSNSSNQLPISNQVVSPSRDQCSSSTPQMDFVFPATLPILRHKSRLKSFSPYQNSFGSPSYGSPSRLHTFFKHLSWREVKGHLSYDIGRGGFGQVYKAHIHGFNLAVKKLRYTMMNKNAIMKSLQSERLALTLKHKNIVTTYHVNDKSDPAFIIMEYTGSQTLQQLIDCDDIKSYQVRNFSNDVASALDYIHCLNMVHLDVKPSNILITGYYLAKLGDFGCAQTLQWDDTVDSFSPTNRIDITGTVAYRAPEILRGFAPSVKADIYAFGILVWQMMSGKHPYVGKDSHMVIFAVVAQGLRPSVSSLEVENEDFTDLCQKCWSADPHTRPDAKAILLTLHTICVNEDKGTGQPLLR